MPAALLEETRKALGGARLSRLTSRSLRHDRFADPEAREEARKDWFHDLIATPSESVILQRPWHPPSTELLYARLMSRMMVNLAGGVMENANLCLDRYGLPYIPGSAVKGCARRMALRALHDWVANGTERPADDDAGAPCCENFKTPVDMLAAIARVFGWVSTDWSMGKTKEEHWKSDFVWAADGHHGLVAAAHEAAGGYDTFAGTVAFLPAYPNRDPGLELDVVTPHHTAYYEQKAGYEDAPDTEDPVPVYFPAIKSQISEDYYSFPLHPLRSANPNKLNHVSTWLAWGLELLGLGAKTASGYGWFDASPEFQIKIQNRKRKEQEEREKQEQAALDRKAAEEIKRKKAEVEEILKALSPEEQEDWKIAKLNDAQFDARVRAFCKEAKKGGPSPEQQAAIVRALRGPRADYWSSFKEKSAKGELATVQQTIRSLNRKLHDDKMP